jgi:hypothetical protein
MLSFGCVAEASTRNTLPRPRGDTGPLRRTDFQVRRRRPAAAASRTGIGHDVRCRTFDGSRPTSRQKLGPRMSPMGADEDHHPRPSAKSASSVVYQTGAGAQSDAAQHRRTAQRVRDHPRNPRPPRSIHRTWSLPAATSSSGSPAGVPVTSFVCAAVLCPLTSGHGADAPRSPTDSCLLPPASCLLTTEKWAGRPETERALPRRGDSRSLPVVCDCGCNHHSRRP